MTWQDPYGQYGQNPYGQDPYGQQGQPGWQNTQPAGWQDPYAQHDPYAQQQPYAGQQGYYGPPGVRTGGSNGGTIAALVANIACAVLCCGGIAWIIGVIMSAMALNRTQTDPESARQLTMWAWVCFVINVVIAIVLIVILFMVGAFNDNTGTTTSY